MAKIINSKTGCKIEDLKGQIGDWLVIEVAENTKDGRIRWKCICFLCGTEKFVLSANLTNGRSRGCGCRHKKDLLAFHTTHGKSKSAEYYTWRAMMNRCYNPEHKSYHRYGGRGIFVCERWHKFENFYEDMFPRPKGGYSLERKSNSEGYSPINCIWTDPKTQARNRETNRLIEFRGQIKTAIEWSEIMGVKSSAILARLKRGWPIDKVFSERNHRNRLVTFANKTQTITDWSAECGISIWTISYRLRAGWDVEKALTTKVDRR